MINVEEILKLDQAMLMEMYISSQELISEQQNKISEQEDKIEDLQSKYDKLVRMVFGRKSEPFIPIDPAQLNLFGEPLAEDTNTDEILIDVKAGKRRKPKKSKHKGRQLLQNATHLERRRTVIEPDIDTSKMQCIGEEVTEKLVYVEPKLYVEQTVRPKYVEKKVMCATDKEEQPHKPRALFTSPKNPKRFFLKPLLMLV